MIFLMLIGINLVMLVMMIGMFSKLNELSQTLNRLAGEPPQTEASDTAKS